MIGFQYKLVQWGWGVNAMNPAATKLLNIVNNPISLSILFWPFSVENLPIFYYFYDRKKNIADIVTKSFKQTKHIFSITGAVIYDTINNQPNLFTL